LYIGKKNLIKQKFLRKIQISHNCCCVFNEKKNLDIWRSPRLCTIKKINRGSELRI